MVAMADGRPSVVPPLRPQSEEDEQRYQRAKLAREQAGHVDRMAASVQEYHAMVDLAAAPILLLEQRTKEVRPGAGPRASHDLGHRGGGRSRRSALLCSGPQGRPQERGIGARWAA